MSINIKCCGHRVLLQLISFEDVEQVPEDLKAMGFKVATGDADSDRRSMASQDQGVIVGIGPTAWKNKGLGYGEPDWEPWAKIGDRVIFGRHSGKLVFDPDDPTQVWYLCNDEDIQAIITTKDAQ